MKFAAKKSGYALATVLVLIGVALFGVGALTTISVLESKISRSNQEGVRAYYVAEAGVEDAMWRLKNDSTFTSGLAAGTLNTTYHSSGGSSLVINNNSSDKPAQGQGFSVTLRSTAAGYATVDVTGFSDNGSFKARRQVTAEVFSGPASSPTSGAVVMVGGSMNINNGNSTIQVQPGTPVENGDIYVGGSLSINNANVNTGSYKINVMGNFVANGGSLVTGGVCAANRPCSPAPERQTIPGFDFNYYSSHYTTKYTSTQFQNLINNNSTINLPGPVTYVSGGVTLNANGKRTINVTGMLVINGSFIMNGSQKDLILNVNDPGNGQSGIFLKSDFIKNAGELSIKGVLYTASQFTFNSTEAITVEGALIAGGSATINAKDPVIFKYNNARIGSVFGAGMPGPLQIQHWEEEY